MNQKRIFNYDDSVQQAITQNVDSIQGGGDQYINLDTEVGGSDMDSLKKLKGLTGRNNNMIKHATLDLSSHKY